MSAPAGRSIAETRRRAAFERLLDAEGPRLVAFARRSCGDGSDAEDVAQETFVQAFRGMDRLERPEQARAWLYTIARRVCQRLHRKRAGEPRRLESLEALLPRSSSPVPALADPSDPLADRQRAESRELVERALVELPEPFRRTLVLAEVAELSVAEIAAVLGVREATVKTRLHRARLKLRRAIEEGLPRRPAPPPDHPRSVCLDLLRSKLEAMDRHAAFPYSDDALCERCRGLLATLDLACEGCMALGRGAMDPRLRERILAASAAR